MLRLSGPPRVKRGLHCDLFRRAGRRQKPGVGSRSTSKLSRVEGKPAARKGIVQDLHLVRHQRADIADSGRSRDNVPVDGNGDHAAAGSPVPRREIGGLLRGSVYTTIGTNGIRRKEDGSCSERCRKDGSSASSMWIWDLQKQVARPYARHEPLSIRRFLWCTIGGRMAERDSFDSLAVAARDPLLDVCGHRCIGVQRQRARLRLVSTARTGPRPDRIAAVRDAQRNRRPEVERRGSGIPTFTLIPAGLDNTRSPLRPVAVTVSVAACPAG